MVHNVPILKPEQCSCSSPVDLDFRQAYFLFTLKNFLQQFFQCKLGSNNSLRIFLISKCSPPPRPCISLSVFRFLLDRDFQAMCFIFLSALQLILLSSSLLIFLREVSCHIYLEGWANVMCFCVPLTGCFSLFVCLFVFSFTMICLVQQFSLVQQGFLGKFFKLIFPMRVIEFPGVLGLFCIKCG